MKIFFNSRSLARAVKSGKLLDNGAQFDNKRWSREIQLTSNKKPDNIKESQVLSLKDWRKPEIAKVVKVTTKKLKEMI